MPESGARGVVQAMTHLSLKGFRSLSVTVAIRFCTQGEHSHVLPLSTKPHRVRVNPFIAVMLLENDRSAKFETFQPFCLLLRTGM